MDRFTSLQHVPAETRRLLRQRLSAFLPVAEVAIHREITTILDDEVFLELLTRLHIEFECDIEVAEKTYSELTSQVDDAPSLDDLVSDGWIRVIWGRISAQYEITRAGSSAGAMTGYQTLMAKRHAQRYRFSDAGGARPELAPLVAAIELENRIPAGTFCPNPQWVAARLWDRRDRTDGDAVSALRLWVDRWVAMGAPPITLAESWAPNDAEEFRDISLKVLSSVSALPGWNDTRQRIVSELAIVGDRQWQEAERLVPALPDSYIGRALWLDNHVMERSLMEAVIASDRVNGLLRLLLADIEHDKPSQAPNDLAKRLIPIVSEHPDLFYSFLFSIQRHPQLLADLMFFPSMSALACMLVGRWQPPQGAWDRELIAKDFYRGRTSAFSDAVAVLSHQVTQNLVPPAEVAALLEWLHSVPRDIKITGIGGPQSMLEILRGELARQSDDVLTQIVALLIARVSITDFGTPAFAAALDLINMAGLSQTIEPAPLVDAYISSLETQTYSLTAHRIPPSSAATLLALATRLPADRSKAFLYPINVKDRLRRGSDDNPYTLKDNIAGAIRIHIRILSRAISGLNDQPPDDLVAALTAAIRSGALAHETKGRVAAFSPRLAKDRGAEEVPISTDIAAVLTPLAPDQRENVLSALLETDEPMILAELVNIVPRSMRERIAKRISEITPDNAGEIYSLLEAQARLDKLLTAELPDTAALFFENQRNLKTRGNPPGRSLADLHTELRLLILRGNWDEIAAIQIPVDLPQIDQVAATETVSFFQAIAELRRPGGNLAKAEQAFAQLANRRRDIHAYSINLLAVRISLLLKENSFAVLSGPELTRGKQLLPDAEHLAVRIRGIEDAAIVAGNYALLLLAIGQPDAALRVLGAIEGDSLADKVAAYTAIGLSRVGRADDAAAVLSSAENAFGATEILRAAREHIRAGVAFAGRPTTSLEDDPRIRVKLARIDFRQMDHIRQAETLTTEDEPFDSITIDYVRRASESLIALMPVMKEVEGHLKEDDLTALVQHMLAGHIDFLGWHLSDQSMGGITANGNPGRRDLVICKGQTTLAVIEAVVCDRPTATIWTKGELTSHFQKLFSYSNCTLFFHLTYSRIDDPTSIADLLKDDVAKNTPAGLTLIDCKEIPRTDSKPTGLIARYKSEIGEVKVVFLILDLRQNIAHQAAKLADSNNPRKLKGRTNKHKGSRT